MRTAVAVLRATTILGIAVTSACRPVPRGDVVPAFAPGADCACPAVDPILRLGSIEVSTLGHTYFVDEARGGLKTFVGEKTIHVETTLATISAAGSDEQTVFLVGCRRAKQVLVVVRDLDGDGVAAEVAGERVIETPGRAYGVDGDPKRATAYVYVSGAGGKRILRLKDDDGDGVPDREQVFVDGAKFPDLIDDGRDLWVQHDGEVVVATWDSCVVQDEDRVTRVVDADGDGVLETVKTMSADEFLGVPKPVR